MLFVQTRILHANFEGLLEPKNCRMHADRSLRSRNRDIVQSYSPCSCDTNGSSKYQSARVLDPWYRHLVAQRAPGKAPGRASESVFSSPTEHRDLTYDALWLSKRANLHRRRHLILAHFLFGYSVQLQVHCSLASENVHWSVSTPILAPLLTR